MTVAADRSVVVLLSATAEMRHGRRLAAVAPGVATVSPGAAGSPEVAWMTPDLFERSGGLAEFVAALRSAPGLRWLQSAAAGTDQSIYRELVDRGVVVTTNHSSTTPIAEFVVRAVLDAFQAAGRWRDAQARHAWERHDLREVDGSRWLVVGLGRIGSAVAHLAVAMGAEVTGVRRRATADRAGVQVVDRSSAGAALTAADVVVLAAPLTPDTVGMVDAAFLAMMRPDAVLVNVARGELVDESALLAALDAGRPGLAVLDVFATEPLPPDHPFWDHAAVVITPHSSGMGRRRHERGFDLFADNLARWIGGRPLRNLVADPTWAVAMGATG
jgi:phosphoglycerate dehydrogenase-like enzyme